MLSCSIVKLMVALHKLDSGAPEVIRSHNPASDYYFTTGVSNHIAILDVGVRLRRWQRARAPKGWNVPIDFGSALRRALAGIRYWHPETAFQRSFTLWLARLRSNHGACYGAKCGAR
jgi:hypothetical protein